MDIQCVCFSRIIFVKSGSIYMYIKPRTIWPLGPFYTYRRTHSTSKYALFLYL